jgi:hypothetical protein
VVLASAILPGGAAIALWNHREGTVNTKGTTHYTLSNNGTRIAYSKNGSGTRLPAFVDDEVRELLERAYRIIYRISATGIEILTVKHYRQRLIDRPADF